MEWACTVKEEYFEAFLVGRKRIEVRRRLPKIAVGDVLFICGKNEIMRCEVSDILTMDKGETWNIYACLLCIEKQKYYEYLLGVDDVSLVWVKVIEKVTGDELAKFRSAVGKNPQWFSKVKY
ncbi:MAG: hypothetical protein II200_02025 [Bacteroidaceae bacterium]|nr:hypothetical protein [Bacteroidaceae bacterium]